MVAGIKKDTREEIQNSKFKIQNSKLIALTFNSQLSTFNSQFSTLSPPLLQRGIRSYLVVKCAIQPF